MEYHFDFFFLNPIFINLSFMSNLSFINSNLKKWYITKSFLNNIKILIILKNSDIWFFLLKRENKKIHSAKNNYLNVV